MNMRHRSMGSILSCSYFWKDTDMMLTPVKCKKLFAEYGYQDRIKIRSNTLDQSDQTSSRIVTQTTFISVECIDVKSDKSEAHLGSS